MKKLPVGALICLTLLAASFTTVNSQNIGSKVSFPAIDGKTYTGVINQVLGNSYKIKYDGFNFESWLTRQQFTLLNETPAPVTAPAIQQQPVPYNTNNTSGTTDLFSILNFGKNQGWASKIQDRKLNNYWATLSQEDRNKVLQFINQAKTASAKFFVLKSLLAGDNFTILQTFINELNQYPESYQQEKCLITNHRSIIQQWQYSCSVTTVQTYLADLCPRYAWQVKQVSNFDVAAADPYSNDMADQQKMLLEKYGGVASVRGSASGKAIGINDVLNELVGGIAGVKYSAQEITQPMQTVLSSIRNIIDQGLDEPMLVGFAGTQVKHFILVMKYRYTNSGYQYLIYDPWDGVCDYVNEATILQGSLLPLLPKWGISFDYYYPVQ
ncbi:MAG: hypothetical protein ABIX01_04620 [Chitinophagaceae bacterium]